ncbi:MAG: hypothetical protein J6J42_13615 [Lachnospiraceae bacterium]|nr:hypothetical protein [Lachnospiraceae bacterium]
MFRLWAKIWKENHLLNDIVIENDNPELNRTRKIFAAIDSICNEFDLSKPIWLDSTVREFQKHDKARFYQDNFVDTIEFDYLEIQVIEED